MLSRSSAVNGICKLKCQKAAFLGWSWCKDPECWVLDLQATPGTRITQELGFLSWQGEEKQRTILEIFVVYCVFYLKQERS